MWIRFSLIPQAALWARRHVNLIKFVLTRMSKRRVKREKELAEAVARHTESANEEAAITSMADEALFSIDTRGSAKGRQRVQKLEKLRDAGQNIVSKVEQTLVDRAKAKLSSGATSIKGRARAVRNLDLWGDDDGHRKGSNADDDDYIDNISNDALVAKPCKPRTGRPKSQPTKKEASAVLKKGILPGQSYHPSQRDHQAALQAALAVESKRVAKEKDAREGAQDKSIALMRHYADAVGYGDGDEEEGVDSSSDGDGSDSGSDDDEEGGDEEVKAIRAKPREKLTRAERNKQKTRRMREAREATLRQEKDLLKQVNETGRIAKQLRRDEEARCRAAKELARKKNATRLAKEREVRPEEVLGVALTEELHGTLRQIQPIGNPMTLQVAKMEEAGSAISRHHRKRRANEKPHQGKRIKWVPKYKNLD